MAAPKMFDLDGRVAIVTGGNGGIGRGIALGLAEAGAAVAVFARDDDKNRAVTAELEALGVRAAALRIDVSDRAQLKPAVERVERELGPVDILVNNAGIAILSSALALEPSQWDRVLETNLTSCFLLSKLAAQSMVARKRGKIINIASEYAFFGTPLASSYSAAQRRPDAAHQVDGDRAGAEQYPGQCDRSRMDRNRDDRAGEVDVAISRDNHAHAGRALRTAG